MSSSIKCFKNFMKVEEIRGQRILTSFVQPEDSSTVEIFAKNIPENLNEDQVIRFFENVGPVHIVRLMLNKNNKGNRGFAYVTYLKNQDAATAVKVLDGKEITRNHPVSVKHSMNNCRIFLGGIPVNKTKDEVWQELEKKGISNIVDVIMYRSYNNRAQNRGFVFVEFPNHQYAAKMRNKMRGMSLWNNEVIVDWSVPEAVVQEEDMKKVKILYLRNLDLLESREYLKALVEKYVNPQYVQKVYKFKNYAFVHLLSRDVAEELLNILKVHYRNTPVEVTFAKPPSEYTKPEFRKQMLSRSCRSDTSQSTGFSLHRTVGHERTKKSSPLQEIGNFYSFRPKPDNLPGSNPSSYFSSFEDLLSRQKMHPPSLTTDLSSIPSNLHQNTPVQPLSWSDLLKVEERNREYINSPAGLGNTGNMRTSRYKVSNVPFHSYFTEEQTNFATSDYKNPKELSYEYFESDLQARGIAKTENEDLFEAFGYYASSPYYKPNLFPSSSSSEKEVDFMGGKENMNSSEYLRSFGKLEELTHNMRISDRRDEKQLDQSQYSPWAKVQPTQSEKRLKPISSDANISSGGRPSHVTSESFFDATRNNKTSLNFNCEYIKKLFSHQ